MAGSNVVFNIALGRVAHYGTLPNANDALVVVPLEATGLEADATLRDYDDLSTLLAGASNEQGAGANRKTITSVIVTVDDTANSVAVDFADQTWTGLTGNGIGALLVCYDSDTTGGGDASIIPLTKHSWDITPDGSDVTATVANFFTAS